MMCRALVIVLLLVFRLNAQLCQAFLSTTHHTARKLGKWTANPTESTLSSYPKEQFNAVALNLLSKRGECTRIRSIRSIDHDVQFSTSRRDRSFFLLASPKNNQDEKVDNTLSNDDDDDDDQRNRGIFVLMTVPLAWGTFEPVVRYVYAIEPPIPGLVFSPCYYFVAAFALSLLSCVSSSFSLAAEAETVEEEGISSSKSQQQQQQQLSFDDTPAAEERQLSLPVAGGIELGFYLFLGNALQVLGLKTLNSDRVAFLIQLTTIFVPLVQAIIARNLFAIPIRTWIACLIALSGVGVMGLEGNEQDAMLAQQQGTQLSSFLSQGDFLVIGSALAYTFHCIRLEKYAKTTRAVTLAACKATTETILSLLLVWGLVSYHSADEVKTAAAAAASSSNFLVTFASETGEEIRSFFDIISQKLVDGSIPPSVMIPAIGAVLWTGLITVGYTIYAQSYGQSRVNPSDANLIYTFQPVWTSLIAFFLLGETLGPGGFVGGALIGLAVYLVISGEDDGEHPHPPAGEGNTGKEINVSSDKMQGILQIDSDKQ